MVHVDWHGSFASQMDEELQISVILSAARSAKSTKIGGKPKMSLEAEVLFSNVWV